MSGEVSGEVSMECRLQQPERGCAEKVGTERGALLRHDGDAVAEPVAEQAANLGGRRRRVCGAAEAARRGRGDCRLVSCEPSCSASSFPSDGGGRKAWMTAESIPSCSKREKTRREACSREREGGGSSSTKACGSAFSWFSSSALS